jgi:hypothetical protein
MNINKYKVTLPPRIKQALDIIALLALLYTMYWLITPSGAERIECMIYAPTIKLAQNCTQQFTEQNTTGRLVCVPKEFAQLYSLAQPVMQNITITDYGNLTPPKPSAINVTWRAE